MQLAGCRRFFFEYRNAVDDAAGVDRERFGEFRVAARISCADRRLEGMHAVRANEGAGGATMGIEEPCDAIVDCRGCENACPVGDGQAGLDFILRGAAWR